MFVKTKNSKYLQAYSRCAYGQNKHPSYSELMATEGKIGVPWCIFLGKQRNQKMGEWLMPYLAKFSDYRFKICSEIQRLSCEEGFEELMTLKKSVPTLVHLSRLKSMLIEIHCQYSNIHTMRN